MAFGVNYMWLLVVVAMCMAFNVNGGIIKINDAPEEVKVEQLKSTGSDMGHAATHHVTVHHFARHGLCNHINGKLRFYKALESHFHQISDTMRVNFILDLCSRKDGMLDKWVKEIFDIDGDGYITHFEKEFYEYVD